MMSPKRLSKFRTAAAIRTFTARKLLLTFALVLATYLALIPILQRIAE